MKGYNKNKELNWIVLRHELKTVSLSLSKAGLNDSVLKLVSTSST